jgi:vacuolar-type H+-ATPase subunit H
MKHQINWLFFTITNQPHEARKWRIKMALENLTALVAAASADADAIIAKAGSDASALAQAQSDIANLEAQAVAVVQPLADKLHGAVPPAQ